MLRGLQHETPFARRRFFEQIGGCRRRAVGDWAERPIAVALTVPSEFEIMVQRIRAVRLRETISGKGLGDLIWRRFLMVFGIFRKSCALRF